MKPIIKPNGIRLAGCYTHYGYTIVRLAHREVFIRRPNGRADPTPHRSIDAARQAINLARALHKHGAA